MSWYFKSEREDAKFWTVNFDDRKNKLWCNCPIWLYNKRGDRTCKHTDYVKTFKPKENAKDTALEAPTEEQKVVCKL